MNKKIFYGVLITVLLVSIGTALFLFIEPQNERVGYKLIQPSAVQYHPTKWEIKDTSDGKVYTNRDAGFELLIPPEVDLSFAEFDPTGGGGTRFLYPELDPNDGYKEPTKIKLGFGIGEVGFDAPLGYDSHNARLSEEALKKGEYGPSIDKPVKGSEKVAKVGDGYGKSFVTLGYFEVCDVVFLRKLIFYRNGYEIVVSVEGVKNDIISTMPEYFTTDAENCGDIKIWPFRDRSVNKQREFYQTVSTGGGSFPARQWYDMFERVIAGINFLDK